MRMLMEHYGFEINKSGFIKCPFHKDNHASLKIYDSTNSWYCFSCNRGGDILNFVQDYENVNFIEAVKRVEGYFNLGDGSKIIFPPKTSRISDTEIDNLKFKELIASRNYWSAIKEKEEPIYNSSIANYNELYATACKKLPEIEAQLDELTGQH